MFAGVPAFLFTFSAFILIFFSTARGEAFRGTVPQIPIRKPHSRNNPNTLRKKSAPGPQGPRRPPQSGETAPNTPAE